MNRAELAQYLTTECVAYRETPFRLRAGGESRHYVDLRQGLAHGSVIAQAARFMIEGAGFAINPTPESEEPSRVVAGIGVAGRALTLAVAMTHPNIRWAIGNDDRNDKDPLRGYGLHGARITPEDEVFGVDDIATTGDSLTTLVSMVQEVGGKINRVAVLVDRSQGVAARAMHQIGIHFHTEFLFDEHTGLIVPAPSEMG